MPARVGHVAALFRYPIKSMRGEAVPEAGVGWHGLQSDRRLGLRRLGDRNGFPWLTASKLPDLVRFAPERQAPDDGGSLPTHVRTPDGIVLPVFGHELAAEIAQRHGAPIEVVHLDRGIFDEASVSLIGSATIDTLSERAGVPPDVRRFRPNVVLTLASAYVEDDWVGQVLVFGEEGDGAAVYVTNRDERCAMVSIDPDTARATPELLKTIVRERENRAGVYATVVRPGLLRVGQPIFIGGSA